VLAEINANRVMITIVYSSSNSSFFFRSFKEKKGKRNEEWKPLRLIIYPLVGFFFVAISCAIFFSVKIFCGNIFTL
jgi:hypothetical protein